MGNRQVCVLPEHEEPSALRDAEQELERAEVPVCEVHVLVLHRGEHRGEQTALLSMPILAADDLCHEPQLRLQDDERLTGEGPSCRASQLSETALGGCEVVAIERLDSRSEEHTSELQ